jgi:hypothetical protein
MNVREKGKLRLDRRRSRVRLNFSDNTAGTHLPLRSIATVALHITHARQSTSPRPPLRFSPLVHASARRSEVYRTRVRNTLARGVAVHRVLLRRLHSRSDDV